jgi:hypothetical protein
LPYWLPRAQLLHCLRRTGANLAAYGSLGVTMGRAHVHAKVRDIVAHAYRVSAAALPKG